MKKIVISGAMAFVLFATHAEIKAPAADVLSYTLNYLTNSTSSAEKKSIWFPVEIATNSSALAVIDSAMEADPPVQVLSRIEFSEKFLPKSLASAKKKYAKKFPALTSVAEKGISGSSKKEIAASRIEGFVAFGPFAVRNFRTLVGQSLSKLIVPSLRKKGKAITPGPDGVSPVQVYADRISSALNAPGFAGLDAILEDLEVPARVDLEYAGVPSAKEASAIVEKIMDGDEELTSGLKGALSAALGVEGYNAFVERYNGGSR